MINERDSAVSTGICRDVSIGGMQVLTERTPGPVGTKIRLNVSPSVAQDAQALFDPFVATGSVVRVLEDGKGFSFRFDSLSDDARNSIEKYIAQAG
jgi:c-di-GMP-binding flagellar brake protein YcgR